MDYRGTTTALCTCAVLSTGCAEGIDPAGRGLDPGLGPISPGLEVEPIGECQPLEPTEPDMQPAQMLIDAYQGSTNPLQAFGGALVLSEYDKGDGRLLAGHLGSWFAPPFYSGVGVEQDPDAGFHSGLVIRNVGANAQVHEGMARHEDTRAFWSPGKTVVHNFYPGGPMADDGRCPGTAIRGAKIALPDERGFAHRLRIENTSGATQRYRVLYVANTPYLGRHDRWNWNTLPQEAKVAPAHPTMQTRYDAEHGVALIHDPQQRAALALGVTGTNAGWMIGRPETVVGTFWNDPGADLLDVDEHAQGSADTVSTGFVLDTGDIPAGHSAQFQIVATVAESPEAALDSWIEQRFIDAEAEIGARWDAERDGLLEAGMPTLHSGDARLDRIYATARDQLLLNRWTTDDLWSDFDGAHYVGFGNLRANAVTYFPWTQGTEYALALGQPDWSTQLVDAVETILGTTGCRTVNPLGTDLCDTEYSFQRFSLVRALHALVSVRGSLAAATHSIAGGRLVDRLAAEIIEIDTAAGGAGKLHDFGGDWQLFELGDASCGFDDVYVGRVVAPNAERYMAHRMLADIYTRLGESSRVDDHNARADAVKTALGQLWDDDGDGPGWFLANDDADAERFYFQPMFHTLGYEGLLSDAQRTDMLDQVDLFVDDDGPGAIRSVSTVEGPGCDRRPDWAGPGLYSGNVGMFLADVARAGFDHPSHDKDFVYDLLSPADGESGYAYLGDVGVWGQSFLSGRRGFEARRGWYLEGVSIAQTLVKGVMGFEPRPSETWLFPRIPEDLLARGEVRFDDARAQGHRFSLRASASQALEVRINPREAGDPVQHFRFGWGGDEDARFSIDHLVPGSYRLRRPSGLTETLAAPTGNVDFEVDASEHGLFYLDPA